MQNYAFAIDERPQRAWDWDLKAKNLEFLQGIDVGYFMHVAQLNAGILREKKDQRAAVAIRLAYSHALETFLAFAVATLQAPVCPMAWILRYSNEDLRSAISKINSGSLNFCKLVVEPTWSGLAGALARTLSTDEVDRSRFAEQFARLWRRFAHDFLDPGQEVEYNSLKHGLRAAPGGFGIKIGRLPHKDVPATDADMIFEAGSDYGSSHFVIEKPVGGKIDFRPRHFQRNWHPEDLFHAIQLLSISLENILVYLRARGDDSESVLTFNWPGDVEIFESPWSHDVEVETASFDHDVQQGQVRISSKDQVLSEIQDYIARKRKSRGGDV